MSFADQASDASGQRATDTPDSEDRSGDPNDAAPPLTEEDRLKAFRIAEEARKQFLSWLKWTFGLIVVFLGVAGLKGYSDWQAKLKETEAIIRKTVEDNLETNFKTRTEDVIKSAVEARSEIKVSSKLVEDLRERADEVDREIAKFHQRLELLGGEVERSAKEVTKKWNGMIATDMLGPQAQRGEKNREQQFLDRGKNYAIKIGLNGLPAPEIAFQGGLDSAGTVAGYDPERRVYTVNQSKLDTPALAEYVAIIGRFFDKNRNVLANLGKPGYPDPELWQDLRVSVVNYLLVKDHIQPGPDAASGELELYRQLTAMDEAGAANVEKLAVAILKQFGGDWNEGNLAQKVLEGNQKVKAVPPEVVKEVFKKRVPARMPG